MSLQPKRGIARLQTCPHGGINYTELKALGIDPETIMDFSVCTNPFMPPPGIKEIINNAPIEQYPDSGATDLTQRLSESLSVPAENILVGSGTTELIRLIAIAYFRNSGHVLLLEPTYGEYEVACQIVGTQTIKYRAKEEDNFTPKINDVVGLIRRHLPQAVFICNPNNPTGKYLSQADIEAILDAMDESLLILDEAYVTFMEKGWNSLGLRKRNNVVVLRSMTKDYGLPGLRLGYAVAHRDVIKYLRPALPPWNVNAVAQKAGAAVLKQKEYLRQSLNKIQECKRYLTGELTRLRFRILPSDAHYFLVKAGNATECRHSLLKHGILVRDCTSFGLPEYIRIAPRTMPECKKLITAISKITNSGEYTAAEDNKKQI
jgi:histidinol-phosphate aminotransferase